MWQVQIAESGRSRYEVSNSIASFQFLHLAKVESGEQFVMLGYYGHFRGLSMEQALLLAPQLSGLIRLRKEALKELKRHINAIS